ncbi:MAG: serine hydrolase [Clostridia bacterium]|nr:serine hydrolase [Clostridia bacterium]
MNQQLTKKLSEILAYSLPKKYTAVSYAMMKDGEIFAADTLGVRNAKGDPATNDCTFNVCSVSKIYCTVAVMQLVEQGKVTLDTPICEYLPRFKMPDERYKQITLRHCLNHSSGLPGTQGRGFSVSQVSQGGYYDDVYDYMSKHYLKADPGAFSVYCNDGFTMAEMVVAEVSGETYADFCQNHITDPIEAYSSRLSSNINPDNPLVVEGESIPELFFFQGGGGYTTTMMDLCKFGQQFLLDDSKMLTPDSKAQMAVKQNLTFLTHDDSGSCYGLGWDYVNFKRTGYDLGDNTLLKGGNSMQFGTQFFVIPKYNAVICMSATYDTKLDVQENLLRLFATAMNDMGINIYSGLAPVPQDIAEKLEGTWLNPGALLNFHVYGAHCSITQDDTHGNHKLFLPTFAYNGEEFVNETGRKLFYQEHNGEAYVSQFFAGRWMAMAQKAHSYPALSDAWKARLGKNYVMCDATLYDMFISDGDCGFTVSELEGYEGVILMSFPSNTLDGTPYYYEAKLKALSDDVATGYLYNSGHASRDMKTAIFEVVDGVEYCETSSFRYVDADSIPLYEGKGFEEHKVYRFGYALSKLPEVPEGRRMMILDDKMVVKYDTLIKTEYKPVEKGFILFV